MEPFLAICKFDKGPISFIVQQFRLQTCHKPSDMRLAFSSLQCNDLKHKMHCPCKVLLLPDANVVVVVVVVVVFVVVVVVVTQNA